MDTDYTLVLESLRPDAAWCMRANDPATLDWQSGGEPPTVAEMDAAWPAVRDAVAWKAVRAERDSLLAGSDWTRMDDAPLSDPDRESWAVYRQALRDVPQQFDDPNDVVWPEVP